MKPVASPQPVQTASDYFRQFTPTTYSVPGQLSPAPAPAPVPTSAQPQVMKFVASTPAPAPQPQPQAVQQPKPIQPRPSAQNPYGFTPDPAYQYIAQIPTMFRPQMEGETFAVRLFKNAGLNMLEQLFKEMIIGLRQWQWAPAPPPPSERVIDVTPRQ